MSLRRSTSDPAPPGLETTQVEPELMLWHPSIHEKRDNCRLTFFRLAFNPPYDRDKVFAPLEAFYARHRISSFVEYELLGPWDVLVRAWVPREIDSTTLEAGLDESLSNLRNVDYFFAETLLHHGVPPTQLEEWPGLEHQTIDEINDYNEAQMAAFDTGKRPSVARPSAALGLEQSLTPLSTATKGVRLLITFSNPSESLAPRQLKLLSQAVVREAKAATKDWRKVEYRPDVSAYVGSGTMTRFLLLVRTPHTRFHDFVKEFIGVRLPEIGLGAYGMRAYSTVIADRAFHRARERLSLPPAPSITSREARRETERAGLEFKSSFAVDYRQLQETGQKSKSSRLQDEVVRAVCAMINSEKGGRLVLGVVETSRAHQRAQRSSRESGQEYLTWLKETFGVKLGRRDDGTWENAITGVEVEFADGGPYDGLDAYMLAITDKLRGSIGPNPMPHLAVDHLQLDGRTVVVAAVSPSPHWHYVERNQESIFYVREGASTRRYDGLELELYKQLYPKREG